MRHCLLCTAPVLFVYASLYVPAFTIFILTAAVCGLLLACVRSYAESMQLPGHTWPCNFLRAVHDRLQRLDGRLPGPSVLLGVNVDVCVRAVSVM